jgi:hypothetical protein
MIVLGIDYVGALPQAGVGSRAVGAQNLHRENCFACRGRIALCCSGLDD